MSQLPLPILNDGALRTEVRRSVNFASRAADLLHHVALRSVLRKGTQGWPRRVSCQRRVKRENPLLVGRDADITAALTHASEKASTGIAEHQTNQRHSTDLALQRCA